ncbi:MAG TPA: DUF2848 family protein [Terriglobia bacterium]|nr:DUF2848 family protein [Terriglobia bacterium]
MSNKLALELNGEPIAFEVRQAIVAGYTGRDLRKVRAHIEELERQGIAAPPSVPTLYRIDPGLITLGTEIDARNRPLSGEVEAALLLRSGRLEDALVAVASDFTDRDEERRSIQRSKEFAKPLSRQVWSYAAVRGCWDQIASRSWVEPGPNAALYQSGTLEALYRPEELLERLCMKPGAGLAGTVVLMGTVPLLAGTFQFTDYFACELETPEHATLALHCRVLHNSAR